MDIAERVKNKLKNGNSKRIVYIKYLISKNLLYIKGENGAELFPVNKEFFIDNFVPLKETLDSVYSNWSYSYDKKTPIWGFNYLSLNNDNGKKVVVIDSILLYLPNTIVSNIEGRRHKGSIVKDYIVRIPIEKSANNYKDMDISFYPFLLTSLSNKLKDMLHCLDSGRQVSYYEHSHIQSVSYNISKNTTQDEEALYNIDDSSQPQDFMRYCLGDDVHSQVIRRANIGFNSKLNLKQYFFILNDLIHSESADGGPYCFIKDTGFKKPVSRPRTPYNLFDKNADYKDSLDNIAYIVYLYLLDNKIIDFTKLRFFVTENTIYVNSEDYMRDLVHSVFDSDLLQEFKSYLKEKGFFIGSSIEIDNISINSFKSMFMFAKKSDFFVNKFDYLKEKEKIENRNNQKNHKKPFTKILVGYSFKINGNTYEKTIQYYSDKHFDNNDNSEDFNLTEDNFIIPYKYLTKKILKYVSETIQKEEVNKKYIRKINQEIQTKSDSYRRVTKESELSL